MDCLSHLPFSIQSYMISMADIFGFETDIILGIVANILAVLFGFPHRHLPSARLRHIYSFLVGFIIMFFLVGHLVWLGFATALISYSFIILMPKKSPFIVTFFCMIILSGCHIYRMMVDYGGNSMDFSIFQMILTAKLSMLAFNCQDGIYGNECLQNELKKEPDSKKQTILHFRKIRQLDKIPTLLEYLSYVYFYASVIVGPPIECKPYLDFISNPRVPSVILPTLFAFFRVIMCGVLHTVGNTYFPIKYLVSQSFLMTEWWYKPLYLMPTIFVRRCRYYFAWYFSEVSCISSGFGYGNRMDELESKWSPYISNKNCKKLPWDRCRNAEALNVEITTSKIGEAFAHWNIGSNVWLKYYVYQRAKIPRWMKKIGVSVNLVTKFCAAFWHGFYLSYYIVFLSIAFFEQMHRSWRSKFVFLFGQYNYKNYSMKFNSNLSRYMFRFLCWWGVMGTMNYLGAMFFFLDFNDAIKIIHIFWGLPHVACLVLLYDFFSKKLKKKKLS